MKIYLVSNRHDELVGFRSRTDAQWTATGKFAPVGLPTLGDSFRDINSQNKTFPMIEIELTDEQVKKLKLNTKPLPRQFVCA